MSSEGFVVFQRGILSSSIADAQDITGIYKSIFGGIHILSVISNGQTEKFMEETLEIYFQGSIVTLTEV